MPMKVPFGRTRQQQEQLEEDRPFPSRTYGFVRGRELEGTYPGPPNIGSWILTTQRLTPTFS